MSQPVEMRVIETHYDDGTQSYEVTDGDGKLLYCGGDYYRDDFKLQMRKLKAARGKPLCANCGHDYSFHMKYGSTELDACHYHSGCVDLDCGCETYAEPVPFVVEPARSAQPEGRKFR